MNFAEMTAVADHRIKLMRQITKQYRRNDYAMEFREIAMELGMSSQAVERHYLKGLYKIMIAMWDYMDATE